MSLIDRVMIAVGACVVCGQTPVLVMLSKHDRNVAEYMCRYPNADKLPDEICCIKCVESVSTNSWMVVDTHGEPVVRAI